MTEDQGQLLAGVPLFATLSDDEREAVARLAHHLHRRAGQTVVREGDDSGMGFHLILGGEAIVSRDGREVGRLRQGDFFGEIALVHRRAPVATVTAATSLHLLCISAWNFKEFVGTNPAGLIDQDFFTADQWMLHVDAMPPHDPNGSGAVVTKVARLPKALQQRFATGAK